MTTRIYGSTIYPSTCIDARKKEEINLYVNTPELKAAMRQKNVSVDELSNYLKINKSTFYRRLSAEGKTFLIREVIGIAEKLELSKEEIKEIFFTS